MEIDKLYVSTVNEITFFYSIKCKREKKIYIVQFQYGSEREGKRFIIGDELKTFPSLAKMKTEVTALEQYCKGRKFQPCAQLSVNNVQSQVQSPE